VFAADIGSAVISLCQHWSDGSKVRDVSELYWQDRTKIREK
jgi:hypothetical protein